MAQILWEGSIDFFVEKVLRVPLIKTRGKSAGSRVPCDNEDGW